MNYKKLLIVSYLFLILPTSSQSQNVHDYQKYFAICKSKTTQQSYIIIRKFRSTDKINYLVVNPNDLSTSILGENQLIITNESWDNILNKFNATPYIEAIQESFENSNAIQDAGITHFSSIEKGANLTVDLCPSAKPLDRNLFTDLINNFGNEEKPVPIAVSITGIWMERHQSDLDWLKFLVDKKEISITWINHSYNHNTSKNLPLKENFLLAKGTDLNYEVLETEIKMIKEGLHPSVFFRFPGLVSDKIIFKRINDFGLIPIGSDAWLGKNQWPKNGSIILLHANGNEPIGIERFLNLLNEQKNNIRNNQWLLYDLRESVEKFEDSLKLDKSYK